MSSTVIAHTQRSTLTLRVAARDCHGDGGTIRDDRGPGFPADFLLGHGAFVNFGDYAFKTVDGQLMLVLHDVEGTGLIVEGPIVSIELGTDGHLVTIPVPADHELGEAWLALVNGAA